MNIHIKKIGSYIKKIAIQWYLLHKELPKKKKFSLIGLEAVLVVGLIIILGGGKSKTAEEETSLRKVTVASLSDLTNNEKDLPLIGTVTSTSEATVRSEVSGRLTRVYKKLGDQVYAGQIIGEFENSGERASLLQAEGAYEQAKAARDITRLNSSQAGSSLSDTKNQSLNTIYSTYTTIDDAVRGKTDSAYSDPKFNQVRLLLSIPDSNLASSLENKRKTIETMLVARESKNKNLSLDSDLLNELTIMQTEVQTIKVYLDDLYSAYGKALPDANFSQTSIDAGKSNTQLARQSVSGALSTLVASKSALSASVTASKVAGSVDSQAAGTLASSEATVKQALGAYNAALSRLEKTVVRSPISGTINSLSIDTGDYIGAFTQVAVISNNGALEVISYVTDDDAKRITAGSPATINNTEEGVVTKVASAIDPLTKKIEVRVGMKNPKSSLVNGQSVRVAIKKEKKAVMQDTGNTAGPILIPISALKLTPQGANVFTLTGSSTLVAIPVKEGAILGDQIQILSGLQGDEEIVTDARGLKEGVTVIRANSQ